MVVAASNWEQLKSSARLGDLAAVVSGALGVITGVLAAFGHSPMIPVGVVFCLLCAHAVTFAIACRNQARLQAALDMKRMVIRHDDVIATGCQTIRMRGEPLELRARDGSRFDIALVGLDLDGEHADVKARYFG